MTRIKKRRSGKKRVSDRKKSSAGRRGARAVKKEALTREKKTTGAIEHTKETPLNKKIAEPAKPTGKTRSAGSRRIAAAKSVAAPAKGKKIIKKSPDPKQETASEKKPAKGFAPWNKNKFKRKDKRSRDDQPPGRKKPAGSKKSFR